MDLQISDKKISCEDGLYLLRDIYNAGDFPPHKKPTFFLRNSTTKELLSVISDDMLRIKKGKNGGVWGSKELVCSYAMWLSPEFYLKVMRTFLSVADGELMKAAEIANTEKSKRAIANMALSYIKYNGSFFSDEEKALAVINECKKVDDFIFEKMRDKVQLTILSNLGRKPKGLLDLIKMVLDELSYTACGADITADYVNDIITDMSKDGALVRMNGIVKAK